MLNKFFYSVDIYLRWYPSVHVHTAVASVVPVTDETTLVAARSILLSKSIYGYNVIPKS